MFNFNLQHVPGWVWGIALAGMLFLGGLSVIPEARDEIGRLFIKKENVTFYNRRDAEKACGIGNLYVYDSLFNLNPAVNGSALA